MKKLLLVFSLIFGSVWAQPVCPPEPAYNLEAEQTQGFPPQLADPKIRQNLIAKIDNLLRQEYYDSKVLSRDFGLLRSKAITANSERAFYDALREWMVQLGDGQTSFTSRLEKSNPPQGFGGVGASLSVQGKGYRYFLDLIPGAPAERAGIKIGDRLLAVDGDTCPKLARIRGPEGTSVVLRVQSRAEAPREVKLTRARIQFSGPSASILSQDLGNRAAYLRITYEPSPEEISKVLEPLVSTKPSGLVLDLRMAQVSSGQALYALISHFASGNLFRFQAKQSSNSDFVTASLPFFRELPLVILINPSAYDVTQWVAGVLKSRQNTILIGQTLKPNFGAGRDYELPDGSILWIKSSIFQLVDANAKPLDWPEGGLEPDILISEDWFAYKEADDPYIKAALNALQKMK